MKNIPNYISISRLIMAILLLFPETFSITFYMIYICCGLSDILDGFLARKHKITSELGAKLDSMADIVFVFVSFFKIIPIIEITAKIIIWTSIIVLIRLFNIVSSYILYSKLMLLHTNANKFTGVLLFVSLFLIRFIDITVLEILICSIATFAAIQEWYYIKIKKVEY
jgi:CDP-diacylglycerol--glycerol-3-phosphate 3-phosphatidyltransferase